ncbi:MAG: adenosylcobalamin-dependent ribonucleoside-diphosphate reductase [Patescibacteria group bacterium]
MSVVEKSPRHVATKAEAERINKSFSENALKMMKKRYLQKKDNGEQETPTEMFHRIAHALASVETKYGHDKKFIEKTEKDFFGVMTRKEYTPAGRTVTNSGAATPVVANCIVLPVLDSMESIFQTLKDAALLQQAGSGLGFDFSHLRPAMSITKKSNGVSSGPVSFLKVYNEAFGIIKQQGRHGANMAMMQIDHPDVLDFIRSKEVEGAIRNFNISIKLTDEFMAQLTEKPDTQWYCTWKGEKVKPHRVARAKNGSVQGAEDIDITAKQLFDEIVDYAWLNGEPGIVFIDEVNRTNPLPGLGPIDCSNPCGEQFLHHYDNCNLGSINLAEFVRDGKAGSTRSPQVDWNHLKFTTKTAVRMMDNVIDTFDFPVKQVTDLAQNNRRIGLGIMGFADMLYQLGLAYDSAEGQKMGERVMKAVNDAAHEMSEALAKEKGSFPNIHLSVFANKKVKMRNAALTTVAPTGSISMMFDCSSGIEPNFALAYIKQDKDGHQYQYLNRFFEAALTRAKLSPEKLAAVKEEVIKTGTIQHLKDLPEALRKTFVVAMDISADGHMKMQAAFQRNVDNSISKTINFPNSATKQEVFDGYVSAWKLKCKSATVYRDGSRNVQILNIGTGENIISPTEISAKPENNANVTVANIDPRVDAGRIAARTRPDVMTGRTYRVKTGYGRLYITINNDERGVPFEVFATLGKSGGFFQEQSEAICRMISLSLRSGIKIEEIIDNLKGIRGPMPTLTNKGTILSLPDAIGQILEEHARTATGENTPRIGQTPETQDELVAVAAEKEVAEPGPGASAAKKTIAEFGMMPGCPDCGGSLTLQEGCMSCKSCGFSRCG